MSAEPLGRASKSKAVGVLLSLVAPFAGPWYWGHRLVAVAYSVIPWVWMVGLLAMLRLELPIPWVTATVAVLSGIPLRITAALLVFLSEPRPEVRPKAAHGVFGTLGITALLLVSSTAIFGTARLTVVETFKVSASSMAPLLVEGDMFSARKFLRTPEFQVGDVVLYEPPSRAGEIYTGRIVGLGGDSIAVDNNRIVLNDTPVATTLVGPHAVVNPDCSTRLVEKYRETINGRSWDILTQPRPGMLANLDNRLIPYGSAFIMGDNRDNSQDSRAFGPIPVTKVQGMPMRVIVSTPRCGTSSMPNRSIQPDATP